MLKVSGLSKTYGSGRDATEAIKDLTFEIDPGEFVCIVGPSGCGKTTLLKTISGLLEPSGGTVELDGAPVSGPPEQMALVFQDYSRSRRWGSRASRTATRGSSRAACSSAWRSRADSRTGRRSC